MGRCSVSMDSPLPASAQRLNSSRRICSEAESVIQFPRKPEGSGRAPAGRAESPGDAAKRAAVRAIVGWSAREINLRTNGSGASPEEGRDPTDNRPAEEKIEQEDSGRALFVVANDGRQEVEKDPTEHEEHRATPCAQGALRQTTPCLIVRIGPAKSSPLSSTVIFKMLSWESCLRYRLLPIAGRSAPGAPSGPGRRRRRRFASHSWNRISGRTWSKTSLPCKNHPAESRRAWRVRWRDQARVRIACSSRKGNAHS